MKRVERVFHYARDRMSLGFDAFAQQHPDMVVLYSLAVPKPGTRSRATKEVDMGSTNELPSTVRALRSEAFRTRIVRLHPGMDALMIGRDEAMDIALGDDENASNRHAELQWTEAGPWIKDTGSKNGTTVNGVKIAPDGRLIAAGDIICVGTTTLQLLSPMGLYEVLSTLLDPHIALPS